MKRCDRAEGIKKEEQEEWKYTSHIQPKNFYSKTMLRCHERRPLSLACNAGWKCEPEELLSDADMPSPPGSFAGLVVQDTCSASIQATVSYSSVT